MITVNCPECNRSLKVKEELAGKKARCPGCQAVFVIPAAPVLDAESIQEERPRRRNGEAEGESPSKGIRRGTDRRRRSQEDDEPDEDDRPRQRSRRDEDDDRPGRRSRDEEDEEEEDRPRRKKGVRCPNCGSRKSTKIYYTFWGGFVAPLLINMVRCDDCGTGYNGKHGDYNTTRLTILYGVCAVIGLILGILGVIAGSK